jgi:hypothetical protein
MIFSYFSYVYVILLSNSVFVGVCRTIVKMLLGLHCSIELIITPTK